ncbi:MAG: Asp-tRNA(Asn)/Glu-tRNA(Gln) amidotransferase subunit GatC [Parachlamydiaceae bacterium]
MVQINHDTIKKLTKLSRIQCSEAEEEKLLSDLQRILAYVDQLNEIDTDNVAPCNHVLAEISNVERDDHVDNSLSRDVFLANAPDKVGGMVRVPSVLKTH